MMKDDRRRGRRRRSRWRMIEGSQNRRIGWSWRRWDRVCRQRSSVTEEENQEEQEEEEEGERKRGKSRL